MLIFLINTSYPSSYHIYLSYLDSMCGIWHSVLCFFPWNPLLSWHLEYHTYFPSTSDDSFSFFSTVAVLVTYCCIIILPQVRWLKTKQLLSHSFLRSEVWAQFSWVLNFKLSKCCCYLTRLDWRKIRFQGHVVVGRIKFLTV